MTVVKGILNLDVKFCFLNFRKQLKTKQLQMIVK